jgi:hypothetical protein
VAWKSRFHPGSAGLFLGCGNTNGGAHLVWNARPQLFFFFGTFFPFFRAFDNPMAIACFLLLTRPPFPFGPLFAVPFLYRRISLFTSLPELFEYFRFLAFLAMTVPQIACEKNNL